MLYEFASVEFQRHLWMMTPIYAMMCIVSTISTL